MERDENADQFVPADVFLNQLGGHPPAAAAQPGKAAYKRASLAQLGPIRNKISLWEKQGPLQPQRAEPAQPAQRKPSARSRLASVSEGEEHRSSAAGLLTRAAAAVQAVLPSPGTKQSMVARQEAVRFPSILFGTKPPPKQPMRAPLPKAKAANDSSGWRLASAPQQAAAPLLPVEPAEAEAMDADDDSDSSSEWHDANELQVILQDNDGQSVSSEATTVVPGDEEDDDSTADSRVPASLMPEAPRLHQSESPPLPSDNQHVARRRPLGLVAASEVFHSAVDMLPLDGSLSLATSGSFSFAQPLLSRPSSPQADAEDLAPRPAACDGAASMAEAIVEDEALNGPKGDSAAGVVGEPLAWVAEVPAVGTEERPAALRAESSTASAVGASAPAQEPVWTAASPQPFSSPVAARVGESVEESLGPVRGGLFGAEPDAAESGGFAEQLGISALAAAVSREQGREGTSELVADVVTEAAAGPVPEEAEGHDVEIMDMNDEVVADAACPSPACNELAPSVPPSAPAATVAALLRGDLVSPAAASPPLVHEPAVVAMAAVVDTPAIHAEEAATCIAQPAASMPMNPVTASSTAPASSEQQQETAPQLEPQAAVSSEVEAGPEEAGELNEAAPDAACSRAVSTPASPIAVIVAEPLQEERVIPAEPSPLHPACSPAAEAAASEAEVPAAPVDEPPTLPAEHPTASMVDEPHTSTAEGPAATVVDEQGAALEAHVQEEVFVPALRREFSEADLQYRGLIGSPEVDGPHQRLDPPISPAVVPASQRDAALGMASMHRPASLPFDGVAATPPQQSCSALPASPAAPGSTPVTHFMMQQQEAWRVGQAQDGLEQGLSASAAGGRQSPFRAAQAFTPYAATEYEGDDVVMGDVAFSPAPSPGKPGSRMKLEALALAGLAVARTPLPHSPAKTPSKPAIERRLFAAQPLQTETVAPAASQLQPSVNIAVMGPSGANATQHGGAQDEQDGAERPPAAEGGTSSSLDDSQEADALQPTSEEALAGGQAADKEANLAAGAETNLAEDQAHTDAMPEACGYASPSAEQPTAEADACPTFEQRQRLYADADEAVVDPKEVLGCTASLANGGAEGLGPSSASACQEAEAAAEEEAAAGPAQPPAEPGLGMERASVAPLEEDPAAGMGSQGGAELKGGTAPVEAATAAHFELAEKGQEQQLELPTCMGGDDASDGASPAGVKDLQAGSPVQHSLHAALSPPVVMEHVAAGVGGGGEEPPVDDVEVPAHQADLAAVESLAGAEVGLLSAEEVALEAYSDDEGEPAVHAAEAGKDVSLGVPGSAHELLLAADPAQLAFSSPSAAAVSLADDLEASQGAVCGEPWGAWPAGPESCCAADQASSPALPAAPSRGEEDEGSEQLEADSAVATEAALPSNEAGEARGGDDVDMMEVDHDVPEELKSRAAARSPRPDATPGSPVPTASAVGSPVASPEPAGLLPLENHAPPAHSAEDESPAADSTSDVSENALAFGDEWMPTSPGGAAALGPPAGSSLREEQVLEGGSAAAPEAAIVWGMPAAGTGAKPEESEASERCASGLGSLSQSPSASRLPAPVYLGEVCSPTARHGARHPSASPMPSPCSQLPTASTLPQADPEALEDGAAAGHGVPASPRSVAGSAGEESACDGAMEEETVLAEAAALEFSSAEEGTTCPPSLLESCGSIAGELSAVSLAPSAEPAGQEAAVCGLARDVAGAEPEGGWDQGLPTGISMECLAQAEAAGDSSSLSEPAGVGNVEAEEQPRESATMSFNPLSASLTPSQSLHSSAVSPAFSTVTGAFSNSNPLFAGTPVHPTPPSVTLKTFSSRLSEGTPLSNDGSATPASVGIKLAERLQEVASQLQQPAAESGQFAATPGQAPGQLLQTPGPNKFAFAADVAAMLQALDQRTPATAMMPAGGRAAAVATTMQRQPRAARFSFATATQGAALFDLEGFDLDGDRNGVTATPAHAQGGFMRSALPPMAEESSDAASLPATSAAELAALQDEVAALRSKVAVLEEQREEAVGMLSGYQGSIAQLQDQHSMIIVKLQTENTMLKAEVDQLKASKAEVDQQFNRLYHDKYLPMKAEAAPLRQEAAAMRGQLAAQEAQGRKVEVAMQSLQQELGAVKELLKDAKDERAAALAAATAAQQAEQKLEQRFKVEIKRSSQAMAAMEAELGDMRGKYEALTWQYDEAVHKVNLAKQARERAHSDVERKEEEICSLEVKVKELEGVLRQYKTENSKFFDMKERYKAQIATLERLVEAKEQEKVTMFNMCTELMTRLEREGLTLDG